MNYLIILFLLVVTVISSEQNDCINSEKSSDNVVKFIKNANCNTTKKQPSNSISINPSKSIKGDNINKIKLFKINLINHSIQASKSNSGDTKAGATGKIKPFRRLLIAPNTCPESQTFSAGRCRSFIDF